MLLVCCSGRSRCCGSCSCGFRSSPLPASAYAGVCLMFLLFFGSYTHAGCRFFAGSSSSLLFFVEFLLLLLLVIMSFYRWFSVATPHSVAPARGVYLFASDLPGSSLCLLVSLCVLLGGVILGFSSSGCSSGWLVGVRFPGLGFCQWSGRPCACCLGSLRAVRGFCLVNGSLSAGFCLGLQVSSPFHSPRPRSLSLSALLAPASRPWGFPGWRLCLSWLPS